MPYREELEAALARAEASERELADARKENDADHERIAVLEKQLADANHDVHRTKQREPAATKTTPRASRRRRAWRTWVGGAGLIALLVVVVVLQLKRIGGTKQSIDVTAQLASAKAEARDVIPDPVLVSIKATYVDPRGISDLGKYDGRVSYTFASPSRIAAPTPATATGPVGAPVAPTSFPTCAAEVRYTKYRVRTYETHAHDTQQCGATIDMPSCSVVDIWNEAIRRGAPVNALASIQLDKRLDKSAWRLTISDNGKTVFETSIVDECPIQH